MFFPSSPISLRTPARSAIWQLSDALAVIGHALGDAPEAVCLLLDRSHHGVTVLIIDNSPDDMADLVEALVPLVSTAAEVTAIVLATAVERFTSYPTAATQLAFLDAREQFSACGVDLLDWVVSDHRLTVSLAEVTDAQPLWRAAVRR